MSFLSMNRQLGRPNCFHSRRYLPSWSNAWMRLLERSATKSRPAESIARRCGVSNSPGPVPFLPHSLMYLPSLVNLTMRLLVLPPWPSGDQDIRGRVEGVLGGAGDAGLAQGHQKLAVLIELHDGVALALFMSRPSVTQLLLSASI